MAFRGNFGHPVKHLSKVTRYFHAQILTGVTLDADIKLFDIGIVGNNEISNKSFNFSYSHQSTKNY